MDKTCIRHTVDTKIPNGSKSVTVMYTSLSLPTLPNPEYLNESWWYAANLNFASRKSDLHAIKWSAPSSAGLTLFYEIEIDI